MKILLINTQAGGGGAALAACRLQKALSDYGHDVTMLTMRHGLGNYCRFLAERLLALFCLGFKKKHLWEIDFAVFGEDITKRKEFCDADVVHLHWINQGFLSLKSIRRIVESGKKMVWTMHDQWPMTAICHYSRDCKKYKSGCNNCPLLPSMPFDAARWTFERKYHAYYNAPIRYVACSNWLKNISPCCHYSIPNPIDTSLFKPCVEQEPCSSKGSVGGLKFTLLFAAQKITDERKGVGLLIDALCRISELYPDKARLIKVMILGGKGEEVARLFPAEIEAEPLGFVNSPEEVVGVYQRADAFVLPSLEDNLPNTIMEAMACGLPCVGFEVGGVPEMIDHDVNGYVARYKDTASLADGIIKVLFSPHRLSMGKSARKKVMRYYSENVVAEAYTKVYKE